MERRVILSAALAHAATHSLELTFAALLVRVGIEFGADLAVLGAVANAGTLTYGMTALPSGYLTDRFGPRAVISGCLFVAAGFALLVAVAPNLPALAVALASLGAAIGLYHPAGVTMVSTVTRRRGMAFAAHGIAGNLGVAFAPALATGIAIAVDWRAAYVVLAATTVVIALMVRRLAPTRAEAAAAASAAAQRSRATATESTGARGRSTPPAQRRWLAPPLVLIYVVTVGMGFIYRGSLTYLPAHLERNLGFSIFGWSPDAVAGAMVSLVLLTAVIGQALGGMLSDRIAVERAAVPIMALSFPMLLFVSQAGGVTLLLASAGFVMANFAQQPVINGLIADYAPEGAAGRAFGISFFLTFGLGSFAATASGLVAQRAGTDATFLMLAVVGAVLLPLMVGVMVGAERRRRALAVAPATGVAAGG